MSPDHHQPHIIVAQIAEKPRCPVPSPGGEWLTLFCFQEQLLPAFRGLLEQEIPSAISSGQAFKKSGPSGLPLT